METDSKARVALITGSGRRRVGNVIASYLAERGFSIALHYHSSEDEAQEAACEIRDLGVDCEAFRANVGVENDVVLVKVASALVVQRCVIQGTPR